MVNEKLAMTREMIEFHIEIRIVYNLDLYLGFVINLKSNEDQHGLDRAQSTFRLVWILSD